MSIKDHFKKFWRRYTGIAGIVIAAIFAVQPDVPVVQSPVVRWKSNTEIALVETYSVTTTAGIVEMLAGFESDGASEPKESWTALGLHPFSGATIRAALTHDAMTRGELKDPETCNRVFYELLIADGVQADKALAMYEAVQRAWPEVWRRHNTASIEAAKRFVSVKEIQ